MQKLIFQWKKLISTFWFVPSLLILIAVILAIVLLYIDKISDFGNMPFADFLIVKSADSARNILTIISGAMIGVAGTVFSITLVALTLASSQMGPRLIRNFMYDRLNQVVLGSYVSNFIFCLLVLITVNDTNAVVFIPSMSIVFSLVFALANIVLLIIFIHHIAISIQADTVISNISKTFESNISVWFPENDGKKPAHSQQREKQIELLYSGRLDLLAPDNGYLQYIDYESLRQIAEDLEAVIKINVHAGDYLVKNDKLGTIHFNKTVKESEFEKIYNHFITGKTRTSQQDVAYVIHQFVEIAVRALSPGINDPYTATACVDNLSATYSQLLQLNFPSRYRFDDDDNVRLVVQTINFETLLDMGFNPLRQVAENMPSVVIRLIDALTAIYKRAETKEDKRAIEKHAKMILNRAEQHFKEPNDLKDLRERSTEVI